MTEMKAIKFPNKDSWKMPLKGAKADCLIVDEIADHSMDAMLFGMNLKKHYEGSWTIEGGKEESMASYSDLSRPPRQIVDHVRKEIRYVEQWITVHDYDHPAMPDARLRMHELHTKLRECQYPDRMADRYRGIGWGSPSNAAREHWMNTHRIGEEAAARMRADAYRVTPQATVGIGYASDIIRGGPKPKRAEDISAFKGLRHLINSKETKMKIYQVFTVNKETKEITKSEFMVAKNENHAKLKRVARGLDIIKLYVTVSCAVANLPEKWDDETV